MMVVDGSLLLLFRCVDRMTELYLIVEGNSEFAPEDVFVREIVDSIRFCCVGGCGGKAMIETPLHFLVQCSKRCGISIANSFTTTRFPIGTASNTQRGAG